MNILFLSQIVPYPPHGGVLQRGYNIIREIAKYNSVHLLAFVHPEYLSSKDQLEEAKGQLLKFCDKVEFFTLWPKKSKFHKLGALIIGLFYPLPFSALAHKSKRFGQRVEEILKTSKVDIVHVDTIGLVRYFNDSWKVPGVLTHHNIESSLMTRRAELEGSWLRRFYVLLQAKRLKAYEIEQSLRFKCNLMMSILDQRQLLEMAPRAKTEVIPNGVDTEYFAPRPRDEENAVVYTGGMNMFANKDAVMFFIEEIWPKIRGEVPKAIFNVIGQDPSKELANICRKDRGIRVLGFVEDIRPYVAKSAVYVVPLRVGGGTRMKVLDTLAQGKAIISTSIGCEGIEVTDGRDILIADDPNDFAGKIVGLFRNADRRWELGDRARKLAVEKYGWESIGRKLQKTYKYVMTS